MVRCEIDDETSHCVVVEFWFQSVAFCILYCCHTRYEYPVKSSDLIWSKLLKVEDWIQFARCEHCCQDLGGGNLFDII